MLITIIWSSYCWFFVEFCRALLKTEHTAQSFSPWSINVVNGMQSEVHHFNVMDLGPHQQVVLLYCMEFFTSPPGGRQLVLQQHLGLHQSQVVPTKLLMHIRTYTRTHTHTHTSEQTHTFITELPVAAASIHLSNGTFPLEGAGRFSMQRCSTVVRLL